MLGEDAFGVDGDVEAATAAGARARAWALPLTALLSLLLAWSHPGMNNFVLLLIPVLTRVFSRVAVARARKALLPTAVAGTD